MVEMGYPFTLSYNDNINNLLGSEAQILSEFETSPQDQKAYLEWLVTTIKNIPNKHGIGSCYWAPDWIAFRGNNGTSTNASSCKNQYMFDFEARALLVFEVFRAN